MLDLALVPIAYLAGSIPTGVLLAQTAGVDVRRTGSGNIGATNVARTAGKRLGVLTLVGDAAKGAIPVVLARSVGASEAIVAAAAVAAIAGHVFSVFLGFRGGKGVATGFGVLLALAPTATLIPLVAFASTFAFSRIVSLASIAAVLTAPVAVAWLGYPNPAIAAAVAIAVLIVAKHRENLVRLRAGTEPKFRSRD
jgi:acyl phosphate:glycerol-3-phosphate acyltransferase